MNSLTISINILILALALVSVALILIVLMQRPKQEGLGAAFGSGVTDQVFGSRTTDVLQKGTGYLGGALFVLAFILSLLMTIRSNREHKNTLMVQPGQKIEAPATLIKPAKSLEQEAQEAGVPAAPPATPAQPAAPAQP